MDSLDLDALTEADKELLKSSLKEYHTAKHDTGRVNALVGICENMMHDDWTKYQFFQYELIQEALKNSKETTTTNVLQKALASAGVNIGLIHYNQGRMEQALEFYEISLNIHIKNNNKYGIATAYNNMGALFENRGDIEKALNYYHKSLKIRELIKDKVGLAYTLHNIGFIHSNQGSTDIALEYYNKSLKIRKEIDDKAGMALSYNNIAYVYDDLNDIENAIKYYKKSLEIYKTIGNKTGMSNAYNNLGFVYSKWGDPNITNSKEKSLESGAKLAQEHFIKSLEIQTTMNDLKGMSNSNNNIGVLMLQLGKVDLAYTHGKISLEQANQIGFPYAIKNASNLLSQVYEKQGNGKKALEMYKLHIQMRDSINNEETQKAAIRQQTQYEFEKEQIRKENEAKEQARILAQELKRRNNMEYSLIFLGILALFGLVMMLGFIKVSSNVAEGLIFFAFLILFEFLLVFAEPYVSDITGDEPIYALLVNSGIALVIFPLHAVLERLLKKRIVKN